MAARRQAVGDPERLTERSLAYSKQMAQSGDIKRLVKIGESQRLCLPCKVVVGSHCRPGRRSSKAFSPQRRRSSQEPWFRVGFRAVVKSTQVVADVMLAFGEIRPGDQDVTQSRSNSAEGSGNRYGMDVQEIKCRLPDDQSRTPCKRRAIYRRCAAPCCWSALSMVMAIQAGPDKPCFFAVLLTASTISGVSGTLTMISKPLSRL